MICQRCKAHIPDDKLYCEKCGMAVQIVPDYNPVEDITIGAEEAAEELPAVSDTWWHRWRYGLMGAGLVLIGFLSFQLSSRLLFPVEEAAAEPEEEPMLTGKPQFNLRPGTYSYSPMLTISFNGNMTGNIHYTTDGSTPDETSNTYHSPVSIGEGMTVVRAVFIRDDGIQSEEAAGTYHVVFQYPDEPVFSIPAGTYERGLSVTITGGEGCKIYYTTNGEEPGPGSKLYQGPVYIAPGLTVLQAIAVDEDGGTSAITEAIYNVPEISGVSEGGNPAFGAEEPAVP